MRFSFSFALCVCGPTVWWTTQTVCALSITLEKISRDKTWEKQAFLLEHIHHLTVLKYFHVNVLPEVYWKWFFFSYSDVWNYSVISSSCMKVSAGSGTYGICGMSWQTVTEGRPGPHRQRCTLDPQIGCRCGVPIAHPYYVWTTVENSIINEGFDKDDD